MLTQDQLLNKLESSFKAAIDVTDAGDAILNPAQFDNFIQTVEADNVLLNDARFMKMTESKVNIDRISMSDRVLRSGRDTSDVHRDITDAEMAKPDFSMNQLVAQEFQTVTGIYDKALRRIIGKDNFTNVLIQMISSAAGRDMEELGLFGDTDILYAIDDVLHQTDGYMKKAGCKVFGGSAATDFDPDGLSAPTDMFDAMIDELDKKYLENPDQYAFYVNWAVADGYRDILAARGTTLGDQVITEGILPKYKGIQVKYLPRLARSTVTSDNRCGNAALLTNPDNTVWGVFHEITVEPDRIPRSRRTDYVLSVEADVHFEDEDAAVAAFLDLES
jgi:hypothetical protein